MKCSQVRSAWNRAKTGSRPVEYVVIGEAAIFEDGRCRITPRADHSGQAVVTENTCDFMIGKNSAISNLYLVRGCLCVAGLLSLKLIAQPSMVIIDPGHGGVDRGGMPGQRLPEKGIYP
jgi:N-acetylmuramoyl-L-alanine amidase